MHKKLCQRGEVLAKEGNDSEKIFLIFKGEFEVSKMVTSDTT